MVCRIKAELYLYRTCIFYFIFLPQSGSFNKGAVFPSCSKYLLKLYTFTRPCRKIPIKPTIFSLAVILCRLSLVFTMALQFVLFVGHVCRGSSHYEKIKLVSNSTNLTTPLAAVLFVCFGKRDILWHHILTGSTFFKSDLNRRVIVFVVLSLLVWSLFFFPPQALKLSTSHWSDLGVLSFCFPSFLPAWVPHQFMRDIFYWFSLLAHS